MSNVFFLKTEIKSVSLAFIPCTVRAYKGKEKVGSGKRREGGREEKKEK